MVVSVRRSIVPTIARGLQIRISVKEFRRVIKQDDSRIDEDDSVTVSKNGVNGVPFESSFRERSLLRLADHSGDSGIPRRFRDALIICDDHSSLYQSILLDAVL